ncbi:MAG: hypothetical protein canaca05_09560 [Anaerolineaceae bacterium]
MRKTIFRLALITIAVLLVAVAPAAAQTGTVVRVDPAFLQVVPDAPFTLTIQIDDVVNLYAFDVRVSFPPDKLEVVDASRGDFLEGPFLVDLITLDNEAGTVTAIVSKQGEFAEPQSGSGSLLEITFQPLGDRTDADIMLSEVTLSDNNGFAIPCSLQDGRVHIGAYPLYLPLVLR